MKTIKVPVKLSAQQSELVTKRGEKAEERIMFKDNVVFNTEEGEKVTASIRFFSIEGFGRTCEVMIQEALDSKQNILKSDSIIEKYLNKSIEAYVLKHAM